jgi:hypothetical protein
MAAPEQILQHLLSPWRQTYSLRPGLARTSLKAWFTPRLPFGYAAIVTGARPGAAGAAAGCAAGLRPAWPERLEFAAFSVKSMAHDSQT